MHVRRSAVRPLPSAANQRIDTGSACRQQRIDRLVAIEAYRQRGISLAQKRPRRVAPACVVIGSNRGQTRWRGHAHRTLSSPGTTVNSSTPSSVTRQVCSHCADRSEEHTSELQSLMRISYAVFCLKKKKTKQNIERNHT